MTKPLKLNINPISRGRITSGLELAGPRPGYIAGDSVTAATDLDDALMPQDAG